MYPPIPAQSKERDYPLETLIDVDAQEHQRQRPMPHERGERG
jgi:hypothetical protein